MAKKLAWQYDCMRISWVEVAGEEKLKIYGMWKNFKWRMQGLESVFDFRILDLKTYDMVLGLKWLKSIKNAFWNYKTLTTYFWHGDQLCKLQATPPNSWMMVQPKRVETKGERDEKKVSTAIHKVNK